MHLVIEKLARKGLDRMSAKAAAKMLTRLETIAADPFAPHANVKPLEGEKNAFRLRQGDWRAVYRIIRERGEMRVVLVDVRGSVYR
jgi:mRNA-degrading endonuclease RelE of RelBE toxin-antitoxin system